VILLCTGSIFLFAINSTDEINEEVLSSQDKISADLINTEVDKINSESNLDYLPLFQEWETFSTEDGLPSNKISSIRIVGQRVWVGTDKGLAIYEEGEFSVLTTEDGLSHNYILSIDVSELTGEVWIATMSGLTRWSAGQLKVFNQFNSGLANDVVYSVVTDREFVWTATAAGASRYNTHTDQWDIFNEQNAPMHEPWTYGIERSEDKIYIAAWGGGVLEYFKNNGQFRVHNDPDHQMELDLYPDDGLVHDITTGVSYSNNVLWVGTYFGMSRYDGSNWSTYFKEDSGLASNFINFLKAQSSIVYICTDNGFSTFNGQRWATYKNEDGTGKIIIKDGNKSRELTTPTSLPNNYVWAMDVQGDEIWLATADGVSYSKANGGVQL
ncbi:MAG: hypothetical protein R3220_07550, partial [Balneolaceae bacterium]|nr:hypothetical protein [Balneolaceae bacterium]